MKYVIFDLDNCISDDAWRIKYIDWTVDNPGERYRTYHELCVEDEPKNTCIVKGAVALGHSIVYFTARPEAVRKQTIEWLRKHELPAGTLCMRSDDDHTPSLSVKRVMARALLTSIESVNGKVVKAYDDRTDIVEMYTKEFGIPAEALWIHDECAYTRPTQAPAKETAADLLRTAAGTYESRNAVYGDNFRNVGGVMRALFPRGVSSEVVLSDEWHLFELIIVKLTRFANSNLTHQDSIHDATVYSAMVESLVKEKQQ